jgi:hypothetical protein
MKRIITIVCALLLMFGLSQCKKKPVVTDNGPKPVSITLDVNGGSKVDVNTGTGDVTFEDGDVIYVAYLGAYVGYLTYITEVISSKETRSYFSGTISATPDNVNPLYFYFLGNKKPYEDLTESPTTLTVDIINQTSSLPVISAAGSRQPYTGAGHYTAQLANKCALVKFNVTTASSLPTVITGVNNKMTIAFKSESVGSFTPSMISNGIIDLPSGGGPRWAILLPQDAVDAGSAYSIDFSCVGERGAIPEITENLYLTTPITVDVSNPATYPAGALHGVFSVGATKNVYFSQGNLQYIGSAVTPYWQFATNQYEYLGTIQATAASNVDRDLFGWGTSGWDNGNEYYQPYNTLNNGIDTKGWGYGPCDKQNNNYQIHLLDGYANADWGVYNRIQNGGNEVNKWRTLSKHEWDYLLGPNKNPNPGSNCRTSTTVNGTANARFTYATVNTNGTSVKGMIIFPDIYLGGTPDGVTWGPINNYSDFVTQCTIKGWEDLHTAGCVFLPAAGSRNETTVAYYSGSPQQNRGYYWSSMRNAANTAYALRFDNSSFAPSSVNNTQRHFGYAVRLVYDINLK